MARGGSNKGERRGGREKGTPNKVTADVRKTIALIAERNIEALEQWIMEVEDPARRAELFLRVLEYFVPKLSRAEVTGDGGGPLQVHVVRYGTDTPA